MTHPFQLKVGKPVKAYIGLQFIRLGCFRRKKPEIAQKGFQKWK